MSPLSTETLRAEVLAAPREAAQGALAYAPIVSLRTGRCWALAARDDRARADVLACLDAWRENTELGLAVPLDLGADRDPVRTLAALGDAIDRRGGTRGKLAVELLPAHDDLDALVRVAVACRNEGFLVASTETGVGHPHVDRICAIAPDVLLIDPRLFLGVATSATRLEACRAMTELARSIGALLVADGVSSVDDLVELALLGLDLFEGELIGAACADPARSVADAAVGTTVLRARLRARAEQEVRTRRAERAVQERVFVAVMSRIAQARAAELDVTAATIVRDVEGVEALYVLDTRGVQLTETWLSPGISPRSGFEPAQRGTDLGLKEYFLEVGHGAGAYVSRPYVSMASGRVSVTHSRRLRLCDGTHVIVCCDVPSGAPAGR